MTEIPSGQQAVDIDTLIQRLDETYVHWIADGCDPSDAISFISNVALCLRALRTAAPTAPSTVLSDAHAKAADEAWLKAEGGMEAIHATFAAGYEAAVNERAAAPSTAAGERDV